MRYLSSILLAITMAMMAGCGGPSAPDVDAIIEAGIAATMVGVEIEKGVAATMAAPPVATDHFNRAKTYIDLGEYEKGIAELNKVIQLDSDNALVYLARGYAYAELGQYQLAIQLEPNDALAYNHRSIARRNLGHASIATTARYLARMEGEADNGWDGVAAVLGVE